MMDKWEYKLVKLGGIFTSLSNKEEELNLLGDQGWELVNTDQHRYIWIFKRRKNKY